LDKILLEYEQCHCDKIEKRVTITSMAVADSNETAISCNNISLAFDCDQKETCGALSVLGKVRLLNWTECTHPKLSEFQKPVADHPAAAFDKTMGTLV
jgi:hypothetical protein